MDVLAQPTRARLFGLLGELQRPAGTEELAERTGLHPNGIRLHLERLHEAGLVVRARERRPRGRPRDVWSIDPDAPGGDPPAAYADLSRWLVRGLAAGHTRVDELETTGRAIGHELAADAAGEPTARHLHRVLAELGFRPRSEVGVDGDLTFTLANCPYRDAVRENQPLVCALHRGLTQGLLDRVSPESELVGFVPRDPYAAGCTIELRGPVAKDV